MEDPDTTCDELPISDTSDTASEISIVIHSQDEDDFSTDYNAISSPSNYHIPMTPPKTHKAMLPRPSHIPVPKTLNIAKNQQDKDNTARDEITSDMEHTATMPPTRTCPIPPSKPLKATNIKQRSANQQKQLTQVHPDPTPVRKLPLLPTPPAQSTQTFISRPSPFITRPFPVTTCNQ